MNVHIRWMILRDRPEVLTIEEQAFGPWAWADDTFTSYFRQRNVIGMVAEYDDRVVGFVLYELNKNSLHLLNFAVHEDCRRNGVGRAMVEKLVGKLSEQRRNRIVLEVRETNLAAQKFFRAMGFRAISVLSDFYDNCDEDAYLMELFCHHQSTEVKVRVAP